MNCRGFTLIESMIALLLLALVAGLAAPAMGQLLSAVRATGTMSSLTVAMAVARTEAIRRNAPVTVCPSADGTTCRGDVAWTTGWIVFLDADRTAQPDSKAIVQRFAPASSALDIRATTGRPYVRFQPSGWSAGSNLSIRLCDVGSGRLLGTVVVNNAGRARTERAARESPCPFRG